MRGGRECGFLTVYSNFPDCKKRNAEEGREPRKWEVLVKSLILDENEHSHKKVFCLFALISQEIFSCFQILILILNIYSGI